MLALYQLYEKKMYHIAFLILKDQFAAEDAVQEAFLKVMRMNAFMPPVESDEMKRLMIQVIKSAAVDIYRKRKRDAANITFVDELPETASGFDVQLDYQNRLGEDAAEYLALLPEKYQSVLKARIIDELSAKETAERIGISEATVRKRQQRGLQMLRKKICAKPKSSAIQHVLVHKAMWRNAGKDT